MPKGVYPRKPRTKKQQDNAEIDEAVAGYRNNGVSSTTDDGSEPSTVTGDSFNDNNQNLAHDLATQNDAQDDAPGLKLLLKVSNANEAQQKMFSTRAVKPPSEVNLKRLDDDDDKKADSDEDNDSDLEPLSEKVGQPLEVSRICKDLEDSEQDTGDSSEPVGSTRKKRRKRKFRLTFSAQKAKRKIIKVEVSESEDKIQVDKDPASPEPEPETVSVPMPSRWRLGEYTEMQLLLDNLLRTLQRKDPEQYFALPVTDEIAPNYSNVISKPMDFFTMRLKLDSGEYNSPLELKNDVELICSNAMKYNDQNTVYHQAAKKLQLVANHVYSSENVSSLLKTLPFIRTVTLETFGFSSAADTTIEANPAVLDSATERYMCIADNMSPEEILVSAKKAASSAADKLARRKPHCRLAFLKQQDDGTTVLNFVTPEKCFPEEELAKSEDLVTQRHPVVKLGDLVPKLKEGTPGLPAFSEPTSNLVVPVSYLDYGPYASFAPQYDSTWASLNKEDTDLLLRTYGDQSGAQYAWSLRSFAKEAGEYVTKMVDNVLDALTDGDHSKTVDTFANMAERNEPIDFESLRSLQNLGIDVSYLGEIEKKISSEKGVSVQGQLDRNSVLLSDLESLQYQRLSRQPDFMLTRTEGPSPTETKLAGAVLDNLQKLIAEESPEEFVAEKSVRALMGISNAESDDIDMDVLKEFLQVPE